MASCPGNYWLYENVTAGELQQRGFRVGVDSSCDRLGKEIHTAELEKIPVVAVVGKREVENETLSVQTLQVGELGALRLPELQEKMQYSIINKKQI
ncbi:MAG: His/Gly/Thr/Pro-type tRNA ligase C-terminal domain-containing protein [Synechococcus sp.]